MYPKNHLGKIIDIVKNTHKPKQCLIGDEAGGMGSVEGSIGYDVEDSNANAVTY